MRILITAGPTREPIDAVRFISNRSSGRLGVELARVSQLAGHDVTLLVGPVTIALDGLAGVTVHRFETAGDLAKLLDEHFRSCNVLIMAAAVADYRPAVIHTGKLKRSRGGGKMVIELEPTPDLVAQVASGRVPGQKVVAFALEDPEQLEQRAVTKMRRKGVDAIVANPLGTMESTRIRPVWFTSGGHREMPGELEKSDFAAWLLDRVTGLV